MFFDTVDFTVEGIEVFKLTRDPYRKAANKRPFHAISFRIYGESRYETGDVTITANAGDILFVPAYTPYIKDTLAEQFYVVHFHTKAPLGNQLRHMHPRDPDLYLILFERMLSVQTQKSTESIYRRKQLFYQLLADIEKEYTAQNVTPLESTMKTAISIIHERFIDPDFSIEDIAKQSNMSETYFRRQFQRNIGCSPKQYVIQLKLELAKDLLRSGYYSVTEVSERCGFANVYYFSAFIKRITGMSPRDWISNFKLDN